ncbi:electron transporter, partial [Bifidobacteriaceae bacterium NR019]
GDDDRPDDDFNKPSRTHWDMLLERRSEEELKTLLDKRLKMHHEGWIPDYE